MKYLSEGTLHYLPHNVITISVAIIIRKFCLLTFVRASLHVIACLVFRRCVQKFGRAGVHIRGHYA
jgi:hypothetical protein